MLKIMYIYLHTYITSTLFLTLFAPTPLLIGNDLQFREPAKLSLASDFLHIVFFGSRLFPYHFASPYSFFRSWFFLPSKDGFMCPTSELILLISI